MIAVLAPVLVAVGIAVFAPAAVAAPVAASAADPCVDEETAPTNECLLVVTKEGEGRVTSMPSGIDCGSTCRYDFRPVMEYPHHGNPYLSFKEVVLAAVPVAGLYVAGFDNCPLSAVDPRKCQVVMNADRTVNVRFSATDTIAPYAPTGLRVTTKSATSITVSWAAARDNDSDGLATGYNVYLNGSPVEAHGQLSWAFSGLNCGTQYTIGIEAYDGDSYAVGNHSSIASIAVSTDACPKVATQISAAPVKTTTRLRVRGAVTPNRAGKTVTVALFRKRSGVYAFLARKVATLSATSTYVTSFARPRPGYCKAVAKFAGDAGHLASTRTIFFRC